MKARLTSQPIGSTLPRHAPVTGAAQSLKVLPTDLVLLSVGAFIHFLAEASLFPIVAALIYYCVGWAALWLPKLGGVWERRIYTRVFLVGFLVAGVSGLYRTFAGDGQGDALHFFEMATESLPDLDLFILLTLFENSIPVILFNQVFRIASSIGIPSEQYVGIFLNAFVVALTGVVALKMARLIYGIDPYRFKRLILLFSACGIFWLFSGVLLRDSFALLCVSSLAYAWLYFLRKPGLGYQLFLIIGASLFAGVFLKFVRAEFIFVPIAMLMAAIAALLVGKVERGSRLITYLLIFMSLLVAGWLLATFGEDLQQALFYGAESYDDVSAKESTEDSLGFALIVNQPIPIKIFLGSIYLFVFPIPFWGGVQLETVYHLFKTFNVVYFYFLIPLLVLALHQLWKDKSSLSPMVLFLLFLVIGFTLAIAGSSLETRHHGAFFVPLFLLALVPDLRIRFEWRQYKQLLKLFLSGVVWVHMAWIVLKVV